MRAPFNNAFLKHIPCTKKELQIWYRSVGNLIQFNAGPKRETSFELTFSVCTSPEPRQCLPDRETPFRSGARLQRPVRDCIGEPKAGRDQQIDSTVISTVRGRVWASRSWPFPRKTTSD
jgi:hypothetical protein